jgi:ArsR family transcriptional regulator, arsenate/arsenite/antimonite-responsive transcriptional repressor
MTPDQFHRVSKALADPQRFALLERLAAEREVACQELVEAFPVTQATISHHLKELHYAGLISARREGKCMHFSVDRGVMKEYQAELARRLGATKKATKKKATA